MAVGTVTILGPYNLADIASMATDLSSEAGAIVKSITSWQSKNQVWFAVCTEA